VRHCSFVVVVLAALLAADVAMAQDAGGAPAAEKLFQEGRDLMAQGRYAEACAKLEASEKLDPGIGTLLNLAECFEKNGQTASAWSTYRDARTFAERAGQPARVKFADQHIQELGERLSYLTVSVSGARAAGLSIAYDGRALPDGVLGTAFPVDEGTHRIDATAPHRRSWTTTVRVAARARAEVKVPELEIEPQKTRPEEPPARDGSTQRTIGFAVGGAGIVALAVGTFLGLSAISEYHDADHNHCSAVDCDPTGVKLTHDARTDATWSTIGFAVGIAAVAGGAVLVWTAPHGSTTAVTTSIGVGDREVVLRARF
jgi:serine/threonine-protein kinase